MQGCSDKQLLLLDDALRISSAAPTPLSLPSTFRRIWRSFPARYGPTMPKGTVQDATIDQNPQPLWISIVTPRDRPITTEITAEQYSESDSRLLPDYARAARPCLVLP